MSGTHRDLLFWSKRRCFTCRWGLGPIGTSNSDARHTVLHAQNHRWGLGHIETCNSGPKVVFCMQKPQMRAGTHGDKLLWTRVTSLYGSQIWPVVFWMYNSVLSIRITSLYGSNLHLWFLHAKQRIWTRTTSLYVSQISPVILCMQNSVISTRNTSLYGFQPSSVVLCIQNSHLRTKIACVYGSQPLSVVFAAWFALEWKVCVGSIYHLWFSPYKTAWSAPE